MGVNRTVKFECTCDRCGKVDLLNERPQIVLKKGANKKSMYYCEKMFTRSFRFKRKTRYRIQNQMANN